MASIPETITVSDDGYELPISELMTGRGAVFGKSGAGKSNSVSVIAEELLEYGLPMVLIDVEGEYWGLTEQYDVAYAGESDDADLPIATDGVDDLVSTVLEDNRPLIVDVSGIVEEDARDEFLTAFIGRLFERENDHRKPCLLFVEEIHEFLPQSGRAGAVSDVLVRVAKRGRKRGLGICGLSQRPAAVDKEFITQANWLVWHRLTWKNDTSVVAGILGKEAAENVQSLEAGEALVMSDWDESVTRVQFRRKRTADAGGTPDLSVYEFDDPDQETTAGSNHAAAGINGESKFDGPASPPRQKASHPLPATDREPTSETERDSDEGFDPIREAALLATYVSRSVIAAGASAVRRGAELGREAEGPSVLKPRALSTGAGHQGRGRSRQVREVVLIILAVALLGLLVVAIFVGSP